MNKIRFIFITIILLISINFLWSQSVAKWHTSMGDFEVTLREDLVPITVGNFVDLTNSNFYDNLIFHRVISDFMIQDGCPLGTGYGGPGYQIPDEFHPDINYDEPYVLGMANAGPNTGGSQYFITVEPTSWLNGGYSAFGHVTLGSEIVEEISEVPTNANDKPLTDVVIDSIRIMTPQLDDYTPQEDTLYVDAGEPMGFGLMCDDENVTYSWFVDDELQQTTSFAFSLSLTVNDWHEVKGVISNENYDLPKVWWVFVTGGSDPGYIEGTVTLDGGTGNVEDVEVEAGGVIVNPAADGTYSIELQPGTYNVTATLAGYNAPEVIEDVVVTEGNTTSGADFTLTFVVDGDEIIIAATKLHSNYPNPFNPETNIKFDLSESGSVSLEIYNIKGQLVKTLVNNDLPAGEHNFIWNGKDEKGSQVASGIYLYNLKTKDVIQKKKAILLK